MIAKVRSILARLLRAGMLLAAASLAGCDYPAELSSPISAPGLASYDERLLGTWYLIVTDAGQGHVGTLTVAAGADGFLEAAGTFATVELDAEGDDGAGLAWLRWQAYPSAIDGKTYFNARLVDSGLFSKAKGEPAKIDTDAHFIPHPQRGYWIAQANLSEDDQLVLDVLWEDELSIEPRKVDCGADCSFDIFELSSEELSKLIREAEPGLLFTQRFVFARIKDAFPPQEEK